MDNANKFIDAFVRIEKRLKKSHINKVFKISSIS